MVLAYSVVGTLTEEYGIINRLSFDFGHCSQACKPLDHRGSV